MTGLQTTSVPNKVMSFHVKYNGFWFLSCHKLFRIKLYFSLTIATPIAFS